MPPIKRELQLAEPNDYTDEQRWMAGAWMFDWLDGPPFSGMYEGEARYYMPRLLLGACVASLARRPLTMRAAFLAMDARHGKTAAKYAEQAEAEGLLERSPDPHGDKRKTVLIPTPKLLDLYDQEVGRVLDDARNFLAAEVRKSEGCRLPATGAADLRLQGKIAENRHVRRAMEMLAPRQNGAQPAKTSPEGLLHGRLSFLSKG